MVKLEDLPRTIEISGRDENLLLLGTVAYEGPSMTRASITKESGGHYVAYSYRRGNTSWMKMDDLHDKCNFVNNKKKLHLDY